MFSIQVHLYPQLKREFLYSLKDFQCPSQDLNPGPLASDPIALPNELSLLAWRMSLIWTICKRSDRFAIAVCIQGHLKWVNFLKYTIQGKIAGLRPAIFSGTPGNFKT